MAACTVGLPAASARPAADVLDNGMRVCSGARLPASSPTARCRSVVVLLPADRAVELPFRYRKGPCSPHIDRSCCSNRDHMAPNTEHSAATLTDQYE